jgi:hypothetical protein
VRIRGNILLLFILISGANAFAQQLSHQIIVPAAGLTIGGGYDFSQTIGETAVELIKSDDFTLTQGYQQPRMIFVLGPPPPGTGVNIGPNPAKDDLFIYLWGEESRTYRITIININGNLAYSCDYKYYDNFYCRENISLSKLVTGFYIVKIFSTDGVINRSFKLEKL